MLNAKHSTFLLRFRINFECVPPSPATGKCAFTLEMQIDHFSYIRNKSWRFYTVTTITWLGNCLNTSLAVKSINAKYFNSYAMEIYDKQLYNLSIRISKTSSLLMTFILFLFRVTIFLNKNGNSNIKWHYSLCYRKGL